MMPTRLVVITICLLRMVSSARETLRACRAYCMA